LLFFCLEAKREDLKQKLSYFFVFFLETKQKNLEQKDWLIYFCLEANWED
jgi:hypothetical protein